jgi:hypothetical protein
VRADSPIIGSGTDKPAPTRRCKLGHIALVKDGENTVQPHSALMASWPTARLMLI